MMNKKSKKNFCRKTACIILTAAMCATFAAGQFTAFANQAANSATVEESGNASSTSHTLGFKNANGKVNLTDIKLSNLSEQVLVNDNAQYANQTKTVIVKLDSAPVCDGGDLTEIKAQQKAFLKGLSASGISYEYKNSYTNIVNAVAVSVPLNSLKSIKAMGGVSTVSVSNTYARPAEIEGSGSGQTNYSNIYASGIYNSSAYTEQGIDGEGMTVAILDTGLDYTHEAFNPDNMKNPEAGMTFSEVEEVFAANEMEAEVRSGATAADVYVNPKVPFAYDYADNDADVYASYSQHGTHVAGIVAGKTKEGEHYTDKDGLDSGNRFLGVAPEAQLVICKVFTDDLDSENIGGATSEDIISALDDCVSLNVDVINMSLGTTAGFSTEALGLTPEDDEGILLNEVFEKIRAKGISLMTAASNDYSAGFGSQFGTNLATNPDSGTVGSPSTYDGAMSVASINGQYSPYLLANAKMENGTVNGDAIYYEESRNEDSDAYNFLEEMLGKENQGTFNYVEVPGYGDTTDYTNTVMGELNRLKNENPDGKVIALVKRGGNGLTFKKKIQTAKNKGFDAVIVYNNVSGMIRMSLEDLDERIPAISVSMDAGELLTGGADRKGTGTVTLNKDFKAGPFMNDYSSWGVTPDLKLKPDVTSHGGEIISAVAGGYEEMSGTSMACPNLAGFTALLRSELRDKHADLWKGANDTESAVNLANLTNNIMMSTATTVYDQNGLPYSPRKQGAGLATLKNVFGTSAYLSTKLTDNKIDTEYMCADGRPKAELGEDEAKSGVYNIVFYVNNFGDKELKFTAKTIFMTETLGKDGLSVAEKAHLFDSVGEWKVDGKAIAEGGEITVGKGKSKIEVTLKLSDAEKKYLNTNFINGMFVEGFLQLVSQTADQCSLSLPFMGFYGDWEAAPLLDYNCFEIAKFDKDTSLSYEERPKASVWATQAYSYYWNDKYSTPLGNFLYLQDPDKEHTSEYVYCEEEHAALSRFNEYYGESSNNNYCTVSGIRGLYAGLLRNAEIVTYTLTNVDTGEIIPDENGNTVREVYRLRKAHSSGGNAVPSQVEMEMRVEDMNFEGNGKYRLDYNFYFEYDDYKAGKPTDDTFSMSFYVDYEAPVLVDSRIRYQDVKDNGKTTQKIYLDLDIYDNHYPQAVLLCYSVSNDNDGSQIDALRLATEYITPIVNPKKNTTNTVSIDVTDFYEEYRGNLFVEIDDYAMNHNVYEIQSFSHAEGAVCPTDWSVKDTLTLDKNTAAKVSIENIGNANASNFTWSSDDESIAMVKNGEVFGVAAGTTNITVTGGTKSRTIKVTVKESSKTIKTPSVSFGTMLNEFYNPVKAQGIVNVNPGEKIPLSINVEPWYYPEDSLSFTWSSSDESVATVDQNGNVTILHEDYKEGKVKTVTITAQCNEFKCKATVTLAVQDPFTVANGTLTQYRGLGGELRDSITVGSQTFNNVRVLEIPSDKSIMTIGEEAFKDVESVEVVIIPKAVTSISQRAFENCVNLKAICFISEKKKEIADSSLDLIYRNAFMGCTSLTVVDLSNCKVITLDMDAFSGCTGLKEVVQMTSIGTAYDRAFAGCTSLESADLTGLHVAGRNVFYGCTGLQSIKTGNFTAFGTGMFSGCTALNNDAETGNEGIVINCANIPARSFENCNSLTKVTFTAPDVSIGDYAFYKCSNLITADVQSGASYVGNYAFGSCYPLNVQALKSQIAGAEFGYNVFSMLETGEFISGNKLIFAANTITDSNYLVNNGITEIGEYAFAGSSLSGITTLDLTGVTKIGEGAFYGLSGLTSVTIPEGITEIADYAFADTGLTSIIIPSTVKKIGAHTFDGCSSLTSVTFGNGLTDIGEYAFFNSGIEGDLILPESLVKIGDSAFSECNRILTVNIPSVEVMGEGVFMNCANIHTATYGAKAKVTGRYTFYAFDETSMTKTQSSLVTVNLGENITKLDRGVFTYCNKLTSIDLNKVTEIGAEAFAGCTALENVIGIERVTHFGENAFAEAAMAAVNLAAANQIDSRAFYTCANLDSVKLGNSLKSIGDEAFAGSKLRTVEIPASCEHIGSSAFSGKASINGSVVPVFKGYKVAAGNKNYFAEDGVLYQYVGGKQENSKDDRYSLIAYPDARVAESVDGVLTYNIIEGTISVGEYAFGSILENQVAKVVFPYTVKTIGHGAFFASGITEFEFTSINAPVLLEDLLEINGVIQKPVQNNYSANSYFYMNFGGYMYNTDAEGNMYFFAPLYPGDLAVVASPLSIKYPVNGKGYDNFIYSHYFGDREVLAEMMEDDTRTLIAMLDEMPSAQEVRGWNTTNKTQEEVVAFSDRVKQAHIYKNNLATQAQTDFVGADRLTKLADIEAALKPVKAAFGIKVRIDTCAIVADSQYKKEYRVGEKFDMNGLTVKVTYEDLSEEIISANGNFALSTTYDRPLTATDNMVELTGVGNYKGARLSVRGLKVTDSAPVNGGSEGEFPVWAIIVIAVGGVVVLAAAAVAVVLVKKSKAKSVNGATEETADELQPVSGEEPAVEEQEQAQLTDEGKNDD